MINELDVVALTREIPEYGLQVGKTGTVVDCYPDGKAYEVEFFDDEGFTIEVLTLEAADVQPLSEVAARSEARSD